MNKEKPHGIPEGMSIRALASYQPSTVRESDLSVEFVLSTETPAQVWDWERLDVVREILVADGVSHSEKIPLQDSHDRSSVDSNLGSVRDIRVENNQVVGRLYFDKDDERAVKTFKKIRSGHLDSGSVGYSQLEKTWIPAGEKLVHNGREFSGDTDGLQLTTKWQLSEYSVVAIGADPNAKARSVKPGCVAVVENIKETKMSETKIQPGEIPAVVDDSKIKELERAAKETLKKAERTLADAHIRELCAKYNVSERAEDLIKSGATIEAAQRTVIDILSERSKATAVSHANVNSFTAGISESEKKREAITDGLIVRSMGEGVLEGNIAAGYNNFRTRTLLQLGEEILQEAGINTRNMSRSEVARTLLNKRNAVATDNTTATFANITANVVNKMAMRGFAAQPHVWDKICSVGSTSDFKAVTRVGLSENGDLPLKKEGAEYRESKFSDRKETGSIGTYADKTTLTEEAIINDDIGLLVQIPFRKGAAAARVPETLLFTQINTPPTLTASSLPWFSTSNATPNDIVQADGLNATNLSIALSKFKQMKAPVQSNETISDYLDIMPKYMLVHPDLKFTADILLQSAGLPQVNMSSAVINPFAGEGLEKPLSSARLTTSTSFYLFADPRLYPTVEMLFLDGRVAPESFLDESSNVDGWTYRIRLRCGIIVLEWRTALRHRVA